LRLIADITAFDVQKRRQGFCKTKQGYKLAEASPSPWDRGDGGVSKLPAKPVLESSREGESMRGVVGSLFERYASRWFRV